MSKDLSVVFEKEVSVYEKKANALVIDEASIESAVVLLSETNKVADKVKAEKEKITTPLNEALRVERARWKPIEDAVTNAVATIKSKLVAYQRVAEEARVAKEANLMARVEKGTMRGDTAVAKMEALPDTNAPVTTASGLIQYRTVQKLVIEDINKIPREFLVVDEVKVKAALKAGNVVPGAKMVEEKVIANYR